LSESSASELVVAKRLEGTEKFLKGQNDAARLRVSSQADALKAQNKLLQGKMDHLIIENA
jgi:hypothetical protein